ncbi:hypothetical protein CH251_09590 [Rhodococcus sp. 06-462-5]|uniref:TIR domain-containing protein n=1 Tax=unclassified Rhodococcus (in: high G+C Gram-positive bacteria) TaxID=192944 RepID=UPI000B9B160D|nr:MULTISPECIES: TIR domain-containing protein [unclassified Rhodococcus (in: high G+C Gram-positive bacteria)]OZC76158.1 hypothetical protein CH251_09590 [Rhodococcus sp. 06-462-5]OZE57885.1 hypothetical protein CH270_26820 [Rhodococcus sp. 02-925g]
MAKKVFLSFHYDGDVMRCQRIRNIGAIEEDREEVSAQKWETIKADGDQAIKNWIAKEMAGKDAVVVLVGGETASRKWVKHEIEKAWKDKVPLVGIRVHGMLDLNGDKGSYGEDPFSKVFDTDGKPLSTYIMLHNPCGPDSKAVYASIRDNFESWVGDAVKRSW